MKRIIFFVLMGLSTICWAQNKPVDSLSKVKVDTVIVADSLQKSDASTKAAEPIKKKTKIIVEPPPNIGELVSFSEIFWTVVIILIGYVSIRLSSRILELFAEKSTKYRITIKSLIPVVKIMGWVLVIIVIVAGVFQPPAATVLAFSASIGVAVGFASQDILKNIFGGIMILFDRPFNSGDKIEVGEHYGEVMTIGLRSTRILTPDDSLVSIPNGEIMNKAVSNANSGEANCQVVAEIYLPINIDTVGVRKIAIEAAQVSKYVYMNKPIVVLFFNEIKHEKPIYKMKLKAYVLDIRDEFKFKSEMTEIVISKLLEERILKV